MSRKQGRPVKYDRRQVLDAYEGGGFAEVMIVTGCSKHAAYGLVSRAKAADPARGAKEKAEPEKRDTCDPAEIAVATIKLLGACDGDAKRAKRAIDALMGL